MCGYLDTELSRLQVLYETASAGIPAGQPDLASDAWAALVAVSDAWTEFRRARGALFREIRIRDLPVSELSRRDQLPATRELLSG